MDPPGEWPSSPRVPFPGTPTAARRTRRRPTKQDDLRTKQGDDRADTVRYGASKQIGREESRRGETIFDLLDLVLLELGGVLGEAQGVEGSTGVLLLLGVLLHAALVLDEGDGDELDDKDGRERAPRDRVAEVGGLPAGHRCPLLRLHPVAQAQGFRHQDPRLQSHSAIRSFIECA